VNWVEHGIAPEQILAQNASGGTRPLCPYPRTAIYNGTGSTDDAATFHCGGDLEKPEVVCADVLARYKREVNGPLAFQGTGVNRHLCLGTASDHHEGFHDDRDHDD